MLFDVLNDPDYCSKVECSSVKFSENGKDFYLDNKSRKKVLKIKVDCPHFEKVKKCDYVAEVEVDALAFYIELKGSDVKEAMKQLVATATLFDDRHRNLKKHCVVVHSRHPKQDTAFQNLEMQIAKLKMKLIKGRSPLTIPI